MVDNVMLITGASKGIGKACSKYFKNKYEVVTVSRTDSTICGDLTDITFRNKIIAEINPIVFSHFNEKLFSSDQD